MVRAIQILEIQRQGKKKQNAKEFFANAHGYIKYLPVDRQTTSVMAPLIDFTGKALGDSINSNYDPIYAKQKYDQTFRSFFST